VLAMLLLTGLSSGCHTNRPTREREYFLKSYYDFELTQSTANREEIIQFWTERANDADQERTFRCDAIFTLLRYLRPGFSSENCGRVVRDARWLNEVKIEPVRALGGWIPLDSEPHSSILVMSVLPESTGRSDWHIYFSIKNLEAEGTLPWEECSQRAKEFLRGDLNDDHVRLNRFVLCYPAALRQKYLYFLPDGVGLPEPGTSKTNRGTE
jgi:hypothetical protein